MLTKFPLPELMFSMKQLSSKNKRAPEYPPVSTAIWWGLAITIALLLFELIPTDLPFSQAYIRLEQWDTRWFKNIAVEGYHDVGLPPVRSSLDQEKENVAFFPGYPLLARFVNTMTDIPIDFSLLLSAQLSCWGMFTYLILLLRRWRIPATIIGVTLLLIFCYPSSFYLVSAYSEGLFFCMLLGMMYWQEGAASRSEKMSVLHGFVMSSSRIAGLPLALYPFIRHLPEKMGWKFLARKIFAAALMMSGGLLFFLFCAIRFGNWHLYMDTQRIGWGVVPQYMAIFRLSTYQLNHLLPHLPHYGEIGLLTVPLMVFWFLILLALECTLAHKRDPSGWKVRLGLYYCAFSIFFLSVAGSVSIGMSSMIRYALGVHLFLVLATMHLLSRLRLAATQTNVILGLLCLFSLLLLRLHVAAADHFMLGQWV